MKVLMVGSDRSVKGGITSVVNQLLNYDWQSDIKIRYIPTYIEASNIHKFLFFIKHYLKILFILTFDKIDIVYIHMSYNGSFFRKYYIQSLSKLFNKKVIIHLHGSEFKKFYEGSNNKVQYKICKLIENCDAFIVLGEKWKNIIREIQPFSNTVVLPNSISIPNEVCKLKESFQILYLGMLIKRKGVIDLIESLHKLNDNNFLEEYNVKIIISGVGPEEKNLKQKVRELNLEKYINFVGWINNDIKKKFILESQLLVLPSYNEGLPVAILEAMSYGMPIIATNVGSISEAVIKNQNGFLIEPGNTDELALSMKKIIESRTLWSEYSEKSREFSKQKFNEQLYFEKLTHILKYSESMTFKSINIGDRNED